MEQAVKIQPPKRDPAFFSAIGGQKDTVGDLG